MTEDDWAQVYFAWLNSLPLREVLWRWAKVKERAEVGHEGSCIKEPAACNLCIRDECVDGGRQMKKAWDLEAARDREGDKE